MDAPTPTPDRSGFADEYPFDSHWLDLDGHAYHYIDEGSGPVLLMVHGNPTWSFAWRRLVTDLSRDHRVVAVDHIGCGFSAKPTQYPYHLSQHATNLETLIERLDLAEVTLCAHDWGGAIGMTAAARQPDRFSRFVLSNTAAFRSQRIPWRIAACRIPFLGALGVRGLNLFSRAALQMAVSSRSSLSASARAGYLAPYDSWDHRVAIHQFVIDIPTRPAHPSYATLLDTEQHLSQFAEHPVLLAWGLQDWCFTPAFLEEFQRRFPQARTVEMPHAGHYLFEDAPEELLAAIRSFVRDYPLTPPC